MTGNDLPAFWLREQAKQLRRLAYEHNSSSYHGILRKGCDYTASAYRRAAVVLDEAATKWEDKEKDE
jgi:hypothetical protein